MGPIIRKHTSLCSGVMLLLAEQEKETNVLTWGTELGGSASDSDIWLFYKYIRFYVYVSYGVDLFQLSNMRIFSKILGTETLKITPCR